MSTRVKRACILSGNGSWSAYGGGTLARLNHNYDTVIGVSTGAIMSPFVALREWEYIKVKFSSLNNKDIYDYCLIRPSLLLKDGRINPRAIINSFLLKRKTIATTNKLRNFVENTFTEEYFDAIQAHSKEIIVGVQNYNQQPSRIHYFNSFYESHEDLKDWMWFSMNSPFYHSLGKKGWNDKNGNFHVGQWCGGKLIDLMSLNLLIGEKFTDVDIILNRERIVEKFEGNKINNLADYIFTAFAAIREDIEQDCLYNKIERLNREGVTVKIYWLPRKLSISSLNFNSKETLSWWEEGYVTALDENRIDTFPPISKW